MYYAAYSNCVYVILIHDCAELSKIGDLVKQLEAEREGGEESLKQKIAELEVRCTHTLTLSLSLLSLSSLSLSLSLSLPLSLSHSLSG